MAYKNITLVTKTQIISKIFRLVCNKLDINLDIITNDNNLKSTDVLIYDEDVFDKNHLVRYKSASNLLAVIGKENLYEYDSCFLIKKPFLPSQLQKTIQELIDNDNEINSKDDIDNETFHLNSNVEDLVEFIDSIDENSSEDFEQINISKSDLSNGGVLDKEELGKLHQMINKSDEEFDFKEENSDINDWTELSDIIDKAIDDVQEYDFEDDLTLVLNQYTIDELKPLLSKFNQNIINKLEMGNEVSIKLVLKK